MSVARAKSEINYREFVGWQAFYSKEPFGPKRFDLGFGIVAATIANANRKKGDRSFKPSDFMPFEKKRSRRMSNEEMMAKMKFITARHNAQIEQSKK